MTEADSTPPAALPGGKLWIALLVITIIELLSALTDLPGAFYDYGHTTRLLIFAQALTSVKIVLAPALAAAGLYFAIKGNVRYAIIALAGLSLLSWATDLPSIAIHGLELSPDFGGVTVIAVRFITPLVAIAAIALAWRNERLGLATLLAALPTIAAWAGVAAFAVGIAMYGF